MVLFHGRLRAARAGAYTVDHIQQCSKPEPCAATVSLPTAAADSIHSFHAEPIWHHQFRDCTGLGER
jgi:hypothetical protein